MRTSSATAARPQRPAPQSTAAPIIKPPAAPAPSASTAPAATSATAAPAAPAAPAALARPASPSSVATSQPVAADRRPRAAAMPPPAEQRILFQKFFKSVGPRTYAAQVKEANNGNHFIVLTEGKRDDAAGEVRKTRLFVFSEDFAEFFDLLEQTARFIKAHPVPEEVEQRRRRFWAKKHQAADSPAPAAARASR